MQKLKTIALIATVLISLPAHGMEDPLLSENQILANTTQTLSHECNRRLIDAAQKGRLMSVMALIPACDVDFRLPPLGISALRQAAATGKLQVAQALIAAKANINLQDYEGGTPLGFASENGHTDMVEFLLHNGAGKSLPLKGEMGVTPLRQASQEGHVAIVKLLLENGARDCVNIQDANGITPVYIASEQGHLDCVDLLIAAKADLTIPSDEGWTALHLACETGNLFIAQKLIQANKQTVNLKSKSQKAPLFMASYHGYEAIVDLLLKMGAEITIQDDEGFLPLHGACEKGHVAIAAKLISQNRDSVNTPNNTGTTPLHSACVHGKADVVALLLQSKAYTTLRDNNGKTAFEYAKNKPLLLLYCLQAGRPNKRQRLHGPAQHPAVSEQSEMRMMHKKAVRRKIPPGQKKRVRKKKRKKTKQKNTPKRERELVMHKLKIIALIATMFAAPFTHGMVDAQLLEDLDLAVAADQLRTQHDLKAIEAKSVVHTVIARLTRGHAAELINDSRGGLFVSACMVLNPDLFSILTTNAAPNVVTGITGLTHEDVVTAAGEYVAKLVIDAAQARLLATVKKDESMCTLILTPACDLDMRDGDTGLTALHIASQSGCLEAVEDLIRNKVNVNIEDNQGRTSLDLARQNGHAKVIKLLLSSGAQEPEDRRWAAQHVKLELEAEEAVGPEEVVLMAGEKKQQKQKKNKPKSSAKKKSWWSCGS